MDLEQSDGILVLLLTSFKKRIWSVTKIKSNVYQPFLELVTNGNLWLEYCHFHDGDAINHEYVLKSLISTTETPLITAL